MKKKTSRSIKERCQPDIPNHPYLVHPVDGFPEITEGFIYSQEERSLHGMYYHKGIDYLAPYGTPVRAAAEGIAIASYHRIPVLNSDGTIRLCDGKPMGNGFGYFVQIYHDERISGVKGGRITQYGHLSRIARPMKVLSRPPIKVDLPKRIIEKNERKRSKKKSRSQIESIIKDTKDIIKKYPWLRYWYGFHFDKEINKRESYLWKPDELKVLLINKSPYVKTVKQGDVIGYTGSSAIIWGNLLYKEGVSKPNVPQFQAWDPDEHLHFEEGVRNPETMIKEKRRDPYGIYLSHKWYKNYQQLNGTIFTDIPTH